MDGGGNGFCHDFLLFSKHMSCLVSIVRLTVAVSMRARNGSLCGNLVVVVMFVVASLRIVG